MKTFRYISSLLASYLIQHQLCPFVPDKSSCVVITLSKWEWFEEWRHQKTGKREDRYKDLKNSIGRRMWEQVLRHFPNLDGKVS